MGKAVTDCVSSKWDDDCISVLWLLEINASESVPFVFDLIFVVLLRVGLMLLADGASDSRLDVCGATRMMLV